MIKKAILFLIGLVFLAGLVQASVLNTKMDFEISGFSGISSLNNSDGASVVISILDSSGEVVVSRNAVAGVYLENMTITMSGAKFDLDYATNYVYNLSTVYGDFLYNFTTPSAGIQLHSGQTTSYATGDDASNDGTAKSSTRTIGPDENAVVSDAQTGLMWQDGDNGDYLNWTDAISYCNELSWGGFSDWRLPSVVELITIYNYESGGLLPAFQSSPNYVYWSSTTTLPLSTASAYYLYTGHGGIYLGSKGNDGSYSARCVRP